MLRYYKGVFKKGLTQSKLDSLVEGDLSFEILATGRRSVWFGPKSQEADPRYCQANPDQQLDWIPRKAEKILSLPEGYFNAILVNRFQPSSVGKPHFDGVVSGYSAVITFGSSATVSIHDMLTLDPVEELVVSPGDMYCLPPEVNKFYPHAFKDNKKVRYSIVLYQVEDELEMPYHQAELRVMQAYERKRLAWVNLNPGVPGIANMPLPPLGSGFIAFIAVIGAVAAGASFATLVAAILGIAAGVFDPLIKVALDLFGVPRGTTIKHYQVVYDRINKSPQNLGYLHTKITTMDRNSPRRLEYTQARDASTNAVRAFYKKALQGALPGVSIPTTSFKNTVVIDRALTDILRAHYPIETVIVKAFVSGFSIDWYVQVGYKIRIALQETETLEKLYNSLGLSPTDAPEVFSKVPLAPAEGVKLYTLDLSHVLVSDTSYTPVFLGPSGESLTTSTITIPLERVQEKTVLCITYKLGSSPKQYEELLIVGSGILSGLAVEHLAEKRNMRTLPNVPMRVNKTNLSNTKSIRELKKLGVDQEAVLQASENNVATSADFRDYVDDITLEFKADVYTTNPGTLEYLFYMFQELLKMNPTSTSERTKMETNYGHSKHAFGYTTIDVTSYTLAQVQANPLRGYSKAYFSNLQKLDSSGVLKDNAVVYTSSVALRASSSSVSPTLTVVSNTRELLAWIKNKPTTYVSSKVQSIFYTRGYGKPANSIHSGRIYEYAAGQLKPAILEHIPLAPVYLYKCTSQRVTRVGVSGLVSSTSVESVDSSGKPLAQVVVSLGVGRNPITIPVYLRVYETMSQKSRSDMLTDCMYISTSLAHEKYLEYSLKERQSVGLQEYAGIIQIVSLALGVSSVVNAYTAAGTEVAKRAVITATLKKIAVGVAASYALKYVAEKYGMGAAFALMVSAAIAFRGMNALTFDEGMLAVKGSLVIVNTHNKLALESILAEEKDLGNNWKRQIDELYRIKDQLLVGDSGNPYDYTSWDVRAEIDLASSEAFLRHSRSFTDIQDFKEVFKIENMFAHPGNLS